MIEKSTIYAIGVSPPPPATKKRERGTKVIFEEILTKHFPKPLKDIQPHIQVTLRISNRLHEKKTTIRHFGVKH